MAENETDQLSEVVVGRTVFLEFQENCWLIGHTRTKEAVCIDPGGNAEQALDLAKQMGLTIKAIASSHGHIDHIAGIGSLRRQVEAKVLAHAGDMEMFAHAVDLGARWGLEIEDPGQPDAFFVDGDGIEVAGLTLQVLHTPGHTPGSVCFYTKGFVFAGDTLFAGSVGRTDLPGGDQEQEMDSICNRLLALPDDTVVLPGHMDTTTIGEERRRNPYVRLALAERGGAKPS